MEQILQQRSTIVKKNKNMKYQKKKQNIMKQSPSL